MTKMSLATFPISPVFQIGVRSHTVSGTPQMDLELLQLIASHGDVSDKTIRRALKNGCAFGMLEMIGPGRYGWVKLENDSASCTTAPREIEEQVL